MSNSIEERLAKLEDSLFGTSDCESGSHGEHFPNLPVDPEDESHPIAYHPVVWLAPRRTALPAVGSGSIGSGTVDSTCKEGNATLELPGKGVYSVTVTVDPTSTCKVSSSVRARISIEPGNSTTYVINKTTHNIGTEKLTCDGNATTPCKFTYSYKKL